MTIKRLKRVKRHQDTCFVRKGLKSASMEAPGHVCYVCGKAITGYAVYICNGYYRHDRCCPGSARWLQSARARVSELTEFFEREENRYNLQGNNISNSNLLNSVGVSSDEGVK